MKSAIRTAVLGVGRMGRRHIQVARKAGCEVVGVYDVRQESLAQTLTEHGLSSDLLFSDLDALYTETKPECVIIATTADSHCSLACLAAERGAKYVLVEKPMAVSLEECDRMIEACERHGAALSVNHQMRFMEQYTEPKRLFQTEAYGEMASMTVVAGNFGFSMNGTHYFEAFRYLAGEDLEQITAWFSTDVVPNPRGAQFEDRAGCIRAVSRNGKRLYMEIGADQGHGVRAVYGCRQGMITINELSGEFVSTEREQQYRELPTTRYGMPAVESHRTIRPADVIDSSAAVLTALLEDVDRVSGQDGRRVVEALVAAHESAERGNVPVHLDGKLDRGRVFPWA